MPRIDYTKQDIDGMPYAARMLCREARAAAGILPDLEADTDTCANCMAWETCLLSEYRWLRAQAGLRIVEAIEGGTERIPQRWIERIHLAMHSYLARLTKAARPKAAATTSGKPGPGETWMAKLLRWAPHERADTWPTGGTNGNPGK